MDERAITMLALNPEGLLDDVRVLALLTALGAFVVTYVGYRSWIGLTRGVRRASAKAGRRLRRKPAEKASEAPRVAEPAGAKNMTVRDEPFEPASAARESPGADAKTAPRPSGGAPPPAGVGAAGRSSRNGSDDGVVHTADGLTLHAPRMRAEHAPPQAPPSAQGRGASAPAWEEKKRQIDLSDWESFVQDVMSQESILARSRGRLSKRRSLQSLLASVRDRDLLYDRGQRIGNAIYANSYTEVTERLQRNHVCEEAVFRKAPGDAMEIRLVGTAMAKEAPVIGTCVCFIEAGLLAGILENVEKTPYEVREVKCVVKGDPFCEFRATREEPEPTSWADDPSGLTGEELDGERGDDE